MNEKSSPATPGRLTQSPEKLRNAYFFSSTDPVGRLRPGHSSTAARFTTESKAAIPPVRATGQHAA